MLRRTFVILMTLVVAFTSAFVVPPQRLLSSRAVEGTSIVIEQPYASTPGADLWSTTRLQAKKGTTTTTTTKGIRNTEPLKKEIDWGKIAGLFLFPGNPYAWFVYFFAFIIIAGSFPGN